MEQQSNNGNFLKAMIRINHLDWTQEQIEAEYQKQLQDRENNPDNCEMCSG